MKNLLLLLTFTLGLFSYSQDLTSSNSLELEGLILDNEKVDIEVYQLSNSNTWQELKIFNQQHDYKVKLNPVKIHKIVFTKANGMQKALYICSGSPGYYEVIVDINFTNSSNIAKLVQSQDYGNYYKIVVPGNDDITKSFQCYLI